jgi:ABC-2 type transport system ATP-binding protein
VDEVLSGGRAEEQVVRAPDPQRAVDLLRAAGFTATAESDLIRVGLSSSEAWRVTEVLANAGVYVSELRPAEVSLEDVFLQLTGDWPSPEPEVAPGSAGSAP